MVHAVGPWVEGRGVVLAFDTAGSGNAAPMEAACRACRLGAKSVRRILWPTGARDACEALERLGPEAFGEFLEAQLLRGGAVPVIW